MEVAIAFEGKTAHNIAINVSNHKSTMRLSVLLILFILLTSCESNKSSHQDKNIELFESLLGQEECQCLNDIIVKFDMFLEQKYGGDSDSNLFRTYLIDIESTGSIEFIELDSSQYFNNNLFNTYHIEYPDSIWIDDSVVHAKYPSLPIEDTKIPRSPNEESKNILINKLFKIPEISITNISSYFLALDSIKSNDTLIENYLETKNAVGMIHSSIMVSGILMYLDNGSEYFCKRIFVMEILENYKLWLLTNGNSQLASPLLLGKRKIKYNID